MNYKILNKKIGTNPTILFEFSLDEKIVDFSSDINGNLYLLSNHHLFKFANNNVNILENFEFNYATSIQWHKGLKNIYVAENGGRKIYQISDDFIKNNYFDQNDELFMFKNLKKYDNKLCAKIKIDTYGNAYCMVKEASRIFYKSSDYCTIKCLVGDGFARYSQSLKPNNSSLNFPTSIDVVGKILYIADCGNNIIRTCHNDGLKTIIGHPQKNIIKPSQIVLTKDLIYYVSNNIYTCNLSKLAHTNMSTYKPFGDVIIAKNEKEDNSIYILESYAN